MQTSAGAEREGGGSWKHTVLGFLVELPGTPGSLPGYTLGTPGFVLTGCLVIQRFSALAVGAGTGPATSRRKILGAG